MSRPKLKLRFKLNDRPLNSRITAPEIVYRVKFSDFSKFSVFSTLYSVITSNFRRAGSKDLEYLGEDPVVQIYRSSKESVNSDQDVVTFIADKEDSFFELVRSNNTSTVVLAVQDLIAYTFDDLSEEYTIELSPRSKI